jgi:hypothetical protein
VMQLNAIRGSEATTISARRRAFMLILLKRLSIRGCVGTPAYAGQPPKPIPAE